MLRDFRQLYPRIDLELTVTQSGTLQRRVEAGHLDMVFIKAAPGTRHRGQLVRRDRLVWVGLDRTELPRDRPVPLVTYPAPSITRTAALRALERSGRTWRITCNTREVNGVLAATRAGLGISVLAQSLVPGDLTELSARHKLPRLGDVDLALLVNPRANQESVAALREAILGNPTRAA